MRNLIVGLLVVPLALAAGACAKVSGGGAAPADNGGGITSANAPSTSVTTPVASVAANVGARKVAVAMPVGTEPDRPPAPAPQQETPAAPPSPAVLEAVSGVQGKLDALTTALAGTRVRFVDCADPAACSARLEAQSLSGLRELLQSVSAQQGGIGFVAREQLDAFTGRTFVADVTLGGAETRPIPADENELLAR